MASAFPARDEGRERHPRSAQAMSDNAGLAAACGTDPVMTLAVALASSGLSARDEALDALAKEREAVDAAIRDAANQARQPAALEPELVYEPELAKVRPDVRDHEIRGKLLFRELVGQRSFFQVSAWAIAGLELSATDAELLEQLGINTQLMDARIWPLAVTRRIAAQGGGLARALVGGIASLCTPNLAVQPVAGFMRFLDRVELEVAAGRALRTVLGEVVERRERIAGLGRPVLGPDERVPQVEELATRYGRAQGKSVARAHEIDEFFFEHKGLKINSAGLQGALMRDMGFSPAAACAFCILYFIVPVLAQAVYAAEHAEREGV